MSLKFLGGREVDPIILGLMVPKVLCLKIQEGREAGPSVLCQGYQMSKFLGCMSLKILGGKKVEPIVMDL